jgi:hypothetical protein
MVQKPTTRSRAKKRSKRKIVPTEASPAVIPSNDPGDATERNYRYQHTYGVILLLAARRGTKPYVAVFCEHHEDLLCERSDSRFDGYQIKTSRPELGAWTLRDREMVKSIGRFVDLVTAFGDQIADLYFVSNTEFDEVTPDSEEDRRRGACPRLFLEHVRECDIPSQIRAPFASVFEVLIASCGCSPEVLLSVLKRMDLVIGPPRDGFEAIVAHEHLPHLPECVGLTANQLDELRDTLVARVWRASSLQVSDPIRHLRPLVDRSGLQDPVIAAKRLEVLQISLQIATSAVPFQFQGDTTIQLGQTDADTAAEKFSRGGIDPDQIELMQQRGRAAEAHLIADTHRRPEAYPGVLRQLKAMVVGECREAYLRASQMEEPFGTTMLIDVQDRLRTVATNRPEMVAGNEYECLMGIATMLTSECRLWWSKRFILGEEDAMVSEQ